MAASKTKPTGRKTMYSRTMLEKATALLENEGLTMKELARGLGVDRDTIYQWARKYQPFSDIIKRSKKIAIENVEESLYKRAMGYDVEEKKTVIEMDKEGNTKPVRIETIKKHIAPDTGAMAFYLKNRDPQNWRDKQDIEHSGSISNPMAGLTEEQLIKLANLEYEESDE